MNIYQFLNGIRKCCKGRLQVCKIISLLNTGGRFILISIFIAFGSGGIYAQHLFSVNYGGLSQNNENSIRTEVARVDTSGLMMPMTRNRDNKEVYSFSLSSVQNTKIVILNEETGNSVVITPVEGALTQFELSPFFIEELRQAALGEADRYLVIETGNDFSVRNAAFVSSKAQKVFIPRYFYGNKEKMKEALPKDRQIIDIFKEKPRLIPAYPNNPENLRYIAQLEEEMSYYVYMYKLPDGTLCIYDEHFNPSVEENGVNTRTRTSTSTRAGTNLQFNLSGTLNATQRTATDYALGLWSEQLAGSVPVDINVSVINLGSSSILGQSWTMQCFLDPKTNTWYPSTLWNQLVGYDATNLRDIKIEMNSNFSFYWGLDGNTSGYDYVTIMLHEVTHGLGFASLLYWDGTTQNNGRFAYTTSSGSGAITDYPGIFDRQLYQGSTGNTCLTDLTQSQRATLVTSDNLYAGRPSSNLLVANGGNRVKMYAPSSWQYGSSVSHWDQSVSNFPTFMKYAYTSPLHTFNTRKIAILRDMGWEVSCPSVINYANQTVTTNTTVTSCGDINVQNVKVQNNAKLTLDAAGTTTITSDFEVILGSQVDIK